MAFTENIDIVNISNLTRITDLSVDDLVIINDSSTDETKVVELGPLSQFFNKELTLNGLGDLALGGAVGKELKSGDGLVWNGNYWVNEAYIFEAPEDGNPYLRKDGAWVLSKDEGVQSVEALAGLENIGSQSDVKLQVDQNWFDSKYASRGDSISFGDIVVENSTSLDEKGRLDYDGSGRFTYYPLDISDFYTAANLPPETDPIFSASAASSIRFQDTINWNIAFSWGDHGQAGYLEADAAELNSLNDVFISSPKDGHIIKYSAASGSWYNGNPSPGKLNDLEDVQAAGSQDKWALLYQAGSQIWASEPLLLEKLTDVEVSGVSNGDYLGWDGDNWVNVSQDDVSLDIIGGLGINVTSLGPTSYIVALDAALGNLNNVSEAGAVSGHVLRYNGTSWFSGPETSSPDAPNVSNSVITINAGSGLSGGGSFRLNQSGDKTITLTATGGGGGGGCCSLQDTTEVGNTTSKNITVFSSQANNNVRQVKIGGNGFVELTDEKNGTPYIDWRNKFGGTDDYDWRIVQNGKTLQFNYDKGDGKHKALRIDGTYNTNDPGVIEIGEKGAQKDRMDLMIHGDIYQDNDYDHKVYGARLWGTIQGKDGTVILNGSKRKNGNYNFSVTKIKDGRIRINFTPNLPTSNYCVIASGADGEGDHMFGYITTDTPTQNVIIYSKDKQVGGDGSTSGSDNVRVQTFAIFY